MSNCKPCISMYFIIPIGIIVMASGIIQSAAVEQTPSQSEPGTENSSSSYVLDFEMERINSLPESLETYKGDVILIVNVASKCGLTPQYEGLEALYREKKDDGFVILAFPANNFGGQEPATNEQIAEFCAGHYDVTFPMFSKISVIGEDTHPLYTRLDAQPDPIGEPPNWNFTKYLVDRTGNAIARFGPRTTPEDESLRSAIDAALAQTTE